MKKGMKKIAAIFFAMSLLMSCFTGCSSNNEERTVRIGIMTSGFTVPLHYGVTNGVFEELGLNVEVEYFDNGPSVNEAIASGDIDVAGIGQMPSITGAIANNSKIVAWMEDDEASIQAYARNDSDIVAAGKGNVNGYPDIYGTAELWKGKQVICAKGTSSHYGLLATLTALGLTENDIELINMEGSAGAAAFVAGTGDIFFGFDPQWSEFVSNSDQYTCVSTCQAAGQSLYTVLTASKDFHENHQDDLTKVIQGLLMVEQEFAKDQELYELAMYDWQNTYGSCTKELAAYSAQLKPYRSLEEQKEMFTLTDGTSEVMKSYDYVVEFMIKNGVIEETNRNTLNEKNAIDPTCLFQAIEKIG